MNKSVQEFLGAMEKQIETLQRVMAIAEKLGDMSAHHITEWHGRLAVKVRSIAELQDARHALRERLGSWKDELTQIWASCGCGLANYRGIDHDGIIIILDCPIDDFPKELMGERCKFVERQVTDTDYVCEL